jgi:hypothetical protein
MKHRWKETKGRKADAQITLLTDIRELLLVVAMTAVSKPDDENELATSVSWKHGAKEHI